MTSTRKVTTSRTPVVWVVVLVVVVVLGIIAVVAAKSSDETASESSGASKLGTRTCATSKATLKKGQPLPRFVSSTDDAAQCQTIPTVKGKNLLDGEAMTISPDGPAKLILFVAHWCPHCQREVPLLKGYLDDHPLPKGVELLTVSTDVQPQAPNYPPKAWLDRVGWTAPTLDDASSVAAGTYGLSSFPYFVVADSLGRVLWRTSGEISTGDFATLINAAKTGRIPT